MTAVFSSVILNFWIHKKGSCRFNTRWLQKTAPMKSSVAEMKLVK